MSSDCAEWTGSCGPLGGETDEVQPFEPDGDREAAHPEWRAVLPRQQ